MGCGIKLIYCFVIDLILIYFGVVFFGIFVVVLIVVASV